jgi:DNA-directed RNA polymerase subunit F
MKFKEEIKKIKERIKNIRTMNSKKFDYELGLLKKRFRNFNSGVKYISETTFNQLKNRVSKLRSLEVSVNGNTNQISKLNTRITNVRREKSAITHYEAKEIMRKLGNIRSNVKYATEKDLEYLHKRVDTAAGLYKSIHTLKNENLSLKVDIETLRSEVKMFGRIVQNMKDREARK